MKVKNLDHEKKQSQNINVDSPRFIATLQRALEEMFEIKAQGKTNLSYTEFRDSFKTLRYNLSENDIKMMVACADEDVETESINWQEFVPIGLDIIRTIYRRNLSGNNQPVPHDALSVVYEKEIKKLEELLIHDLKEKDTGHSLDKFKKKEDKNLKGEIRIADFKAIIRHTEFLTPKE